MSLIRAKGAGEVSTGFYKHLLDQSIKFNDDDTQYFTRTPASAGNRKTYTFSAWVKRSSVGSAHTLLSCVNVGTSQTSININGTDNVEVSSSGSGFSAIDVSTNAKLRDVSAWYNIVVAVDTEQSTDTNRVKIYINGADQSGTGYGLATSSYPAEDSEGTLNEAREITVGRFNQSGYFQYFDGYIAEVNFVDGTQLTADSFGETKNNIWIPKSTSGLTFGTNGFHLTFKDDVISEGFNTAIYEGNSTTQSISGLGFSPGLVWVKDRDNGNSNALSDVVRGRGRNLIPNATNAEVSADAATDKDLISFDADGFSVGQFEDGTYNNNGSSMVAWCWEAGGAPTADNSAGAGATPTSNSVKIDGSNLGSALAGSIAATRLSANTTRGFSIGTFTKGSGNETVAHGLGAAPDWLLVKRTNGTGSWAVYHSGNTANPETDYLRLNSNGATADDATFWGDTAPTSTVFTVGAAFNSSEELVFYAWTDISGYSKFGSYEGNGSSTGPSVTLGFAPAWIMIKNVDNTGDWQILDNTRNVVNPGGRALYANTSAAEDSGNSTDFTSTGFQIKNTYGTSNTNNETYIYMAFADTREAAFFKDVTSNGNHFTPVNLDYRDSVPDVPTNNFCTLNRLALGDDATLSEGNLKITYGTASTRVITPATMGVSSGKWYWEVHSGGTAHELLGVGSFSDYRFNKAAYPYPGSYTGTWGYYAADGQKYVQGTASSYGDAYTTGDIIGFALDMDAGTLVAYKNNSSQGTLASSLTGLKFPIVGDGSQSGTPTNIFNFGQDSSFSGNKSTENSNADGNGHGSFAYAPPSGYLALCSQNLPDAAIIDGTENFNTVLWTGDNSVPRNITGVGFSPDWMWVKDRVAANNHVLVDTVRGISNLLYSNATVADITSATQISAVGADGFTIGATTYMNENGSSNAYVAWNWLAGTAFSNDASATSVGTIDSSGQVNATAGFSIVSYTGTGSAGTIAHGLNSAPEMLIVKNRDTARDWLVYHSAMGASYRIWLNYTLAQDSGTAATATWNGTAPTSTVFSVGTNIHSNESGDDFICYAFHSVEGYCKVGSFEGNNSSENFVYTGFRPSWLLLKNIDGSYNWMLVDSVREPFNDGAVNAFLRPNITYQEATAGILDVVSNGFVLRDNSSDTNASATFIYLAFAEQPFKFANAR